MKSIEDILEEVQKCDYYKLNLNKDFYYSTSVLKSSIGMLFQNPGTRLEESQYNTEKMSLWLNKSVIRNVIALLKSNNLVDYSDYAKYITEDIFSDIYFFDVSKCKSSKKLDSSVYGTCMKKYGRQEISILENIKLVLVFGRIAWNALNAEFIVEPVEKKAPKASSITEVHGYLYSFREFNREIFVIPLMHTSGRNSFLRNSYYDYLMKVLRHF